MNEALFQFIWRYSFHPLRVSPNLPSVFLKTESLPDLRQLIIFALNDITMTTKARREELIIYLTDAADKKVNALYALLEEELKENAFTLTDEHLNILEGRRADFLSGKSKPQPWQEVHARIRDKRKSA